MKVMTTVLAVFLLANLSTRSAMAETIRGVAICAAECNTESLQILNHDEAIVGKIYYAKATPENLSNTLLCISHAKTIQVTSNRLTDYSLSSCVDALVGKYYGKKVDLITDATTDQSD
ncbi:MAG: hypothetical protein ACXVCE_12920, partial [Bacteriovorax sp.]